MKNNALTILVRALTIVTLGIALQPLFAAEEGSKSPQTPVDPGYYGVGPFSYWDRMAMQRMQALRARSKAIREAMKREEKAVKGWEQDQERWLDPQAEAMRDWMEKRQEVLRQNQQAWWRWRDPWGAYIQDRNAAQRRYWDEMAKQRKKAFEQYERRPAWGAFPY